MADSYIKQLMADHEKVILITRRHWLMLASAIFFESVLILIILFAVSIALINLMIYPFIAFAYILILIPLVSMIKDILEWYNHQYIITNMRVMQTAGVFNKSVIDSSLEKVNDVKMVQSFFGRLFNYGDIEILTASELGTNLFRYIGDPILFKTSMLNAKERLSDGDNGRPRYAVSIPVMIEELDQLRRKGIISESEFLEKKKDLLSKI
ncbi:MAG: PH domain-containing protein [Anaerolineae bacterium]|nr:PH domain-containing protein [Anaerolineae bacterium]